MALADSESMKIADSARVCICGRTFSQLHAFGNHQRSCEKSKKRLSGALAKAKEFWIARKRPRIGGSDGSPQPVESTQRVNLSALPPSSLSSGSTSTINKVCPVHMTRDLEDANLSGPANPSRGWYFKFHQYYAGDR